MFAMLDAAEQKTGRQSEEEMKRLTIFCIFIILLTACGPKSQDIVNAWQEALNKGDIDSALSYLAENVSVDLGAAGPTGEPLHGKQEVRGWYETIATGKSHGTMSNCQPDGDTITCLSHFEDEGLMEMGVDFIEGTWVGVVRDGKIQSYAFTISPESLAKFPPPPAPPQDGEVRITDAEFIIGTWMSESGSYTYTHRFLKGGRTEIHYPNVNIIDSGRYVFEGDLLKFWNRSGHCAGQDGFYEVYGTYEGGVLTKLRFALVGEDLCGTRRVYYESKTLDAIP
jgi:hypothetical protein